MSDEPIEEVTEEAIPSNNGVETPVLQEETPASEPVEPPQPGTPEYTEAVEKRIGKVKSQQYKAEARAEILQQELDRINSQQTASQTPVAPTVNFNEVEPAEASYDDYNKYIKDLASWQFHKEHATYTANANQQSIQEKAVKMEKDFNSMVAESKIVDDHPDFYDKMRFVNLVPGIRETVLTSEKAPELAMHLANNPELMRDLNSLDPLVAARKLGAIEAKLSGKIGKKTVTSAPQPLSPVSTEGGAIIEDSPKNIDDWMKKRREQKLAKITQNVNGGRI